MPLTFIEIEKQKSWRISVLFIFLMFMYFCVTFALLKGFTLIFSFPFLGRGFVSFMLEPSYILAVLAFSLAMAGIHFWFSAGNAVSSVVSTLGASPPDPEDGVHKILKDIMEEIHIVTGNKKTIQCMVVPSLSLNALAVADLKGEAVIAVTEGLLSRLTRPQLESVVAHEAYHILSGDCLETTVTASMFGIYASAIEKLQNFGEETGGFHPAFLLFWLLVKLSDMLSLFISREREYRADAASVRMTRNPLAMAEALYLLSRNWTGVGLIGSGIEMLCIIKPDPGVSDESEGWLADLASTHPPVRKRINILLGMAHMSISELEAAQSAKMLNTGGTGQYYYALDPDQQWQGPYNSEELVFLPWLSPVTWVISGLDKNPERASENAVVNRIFSGRSDKSGKTDKDFLCPVCRQPLLETSYENTKIFRCVFCGGTLVENNKIPRIIARGEKNCTERIESISKAVLRDNQRKFTIKKLKGSASEAKPLLHCAKCRNPMFRTFYSLAYLIEIDRCGLCGVTWFDADELKMLQCIIENRITPGLDM